jgi:hypothetical protein
MGRPTTRRAMHGDPSASWATRKNTAAMCMSAHCDRDAGLNGSLATRVDAATVSLSAGCHGHGSSHRGVNTRHHRGTGWNVGGLNRAAKPASDNTAAVGWCTRSDRRLLCSRLPTCIDSAAVGWSACGDLTCRASSDQ